MQVLEKKQMFGEDSSPYKMLKIGFEPLNAYMTFADLSDTYSMVSW